MALTSVTCPACTNDVAVDHTRTAFFCTSCGQQLRLVDGDVVVDNRARTPPVDARVGAVVAGRYKLLRVLGAGGMGAVYAAEQTNLGREIAVKLIKKSLVDEPGVVERFIAEAKAVARLNHPNIITLHDFGEDVDGALYICMELVDGVSLRERMRKGPVPWVDAARIASGLCEALAAVHGKNILHRDLKPENVMLADVRGKELVKLLDFGIAKLDENTATVTHHIVGTPGFLAPEVHDGVKDPRGDLYALGAVLFEMLTGRAPFYAQNAMALMMKHMTEPAPSLASAAPPGVDLGPPALAALVDALLHKRPEDRPADADAVRAVLDAAVAEHRAASTPLPAHAATETMPAMRTPKPTPSTPQVAGDSGLVGRVVHGKYRLIEELTGAREKYDAEQGDYALEVYRVFVAEQLALGRQVALKLFEKRGLLAGVDLRTAIDDVKRISRVQHQNIVAVLDRGFDDDGSLYVASELVMGDALDQLLAKGALPVATSIAVAAGVAEALQAAHAEGVAHPGLVPAGINVVRRSGEATPLILDFGVAESVRAQAAKLKLDALNKKLLTARPVGYSAPERHAGVVQPSGDLYSLGCILYEMLTGQPLFRAPTALALVTKHAIDAPPRLADLPPAGTTQGTWLALDELIAALLQKDPQARPPDAGAVAARLRALGG